MTDDSHGVISSTCEGFPVPPVIKKSFRALLLPGESFDDVFDQLDFAVDPDNENSIWGLKKMTTTVSKPHLTIDKFFPKLFKQEPSENGVSEENNISSINPDSSESEYEMVHNYKNKPGNCSSRPLKKKSISPKSILKGIDRKDQSLKSRPSTESDSNNELSLFHSTAIGKLHDRVPLNVEESGISKVDCDLSHSESLNESLLNKGNEVTPIFKRKNPLTGTRDEYESTMKNNSSGKSDLCQNSKSGIDNTDMSNSSNEENSDAPSDNKSKEFSFLRNMTQNHTLSDDEMIPPSQDMTNYLHLNLGPKDQSFSKESAKSTLNTTKASKLSMSINKSHSEDPNSEPTSAHEISLLEQLKNRLSDIRTLPEANKDSLFAEDLTEDVEVFLIQCPKFVDPASLVGQELCLEGDSVISLSSEGKTALYDSFVIKDDIRRSVNLLLPGKEDHEVKLGVFPLAGNIILTKSTEQTELIIPEVKSSKKVEFPKGLEEVCASIPAVGEASFNDSLMTDNSECSPRKKKKKKKREQIEDVSMVEEIINHEPEENGHKKKKRKRSKESEDMFSMDSPSDNNNSYKTSFEKKRRKLEEESNKFAVPSQFQPLLHSPVKIKKERISPCKVRSPDGASELTATYNETIVNDLVDNLKKKKKERSYDKGNPQDEISFDPHKKIKTELNDPESFSSILQFEDDASELTDTFNDKTVEGLVETLKKKKKKKKKEKDKEENPSDEINFEPHSQIKTQLDDSESFTSLLQFEECSRKKKKKKKSHSTEDCENLDGIDPDEQKSIKVELNMESYSSELQSEEGFKKKKKKKKKHTSEGETEEPACPDVTYSGKPKKKHKKHSIE